MQSIDSARIRASFANVSVRERKNIHLPDLDAIDWDRIDYLGWRDPKQPLIGYVVAFDGVDADGDGGGDGEPVGLMLRQTESTPRKRTQCSWCSDVTLPNDVVLFSTRRSGAAGRRGDSVGTYVCQRFECNANVRKLPPLAYDGFDREAARIERIAAMRANVRSFVANVVGR
ncbi:MAG: FBP domain-containing protein [Pseudoclavibacter sp.]